jgi:hypothetical protein
MVLVCARSDVTPCIALCSVGVDAKTCTSCVKKGIGSLEVAYVLAGRNNSMPDKQRLQVTAALLATCTACTTQLGMDTTSWNFCTAADHLYWIKYFANDICL